MGRIGLAISPADPNVVYATVEAADGKGGIFRSSDKGANWERRNEFDAGRDVLRADRARSRRMLIASS